MITSLQTIAALDAEAVSYQVTGMAVVFACLILLSLILTASGAVAQRMDASRKAKAVAAKAAMAASNPPPSVPVAPAAEMSPAQIAALAAGIYDTAKSSVTPEVVACIAAAVKVTVGNEARILDIRPSGAEYAQSGRAMMMSSRFPVRNR